MSAGPGLDLRRPRTLGELLGDAARFYGTRFGKLVAVAAAVVVPVELIVGGLAQRRLSSGYVETPPALELLGPLAVTYLVTSPLVAAMVLHLLTAEAERGHGGARAAILAGLEAFAPLFVSVLLAGVAIALGLALLVVPGVYLAVRLYLVAQAVVVDGVRGPAALRRSWELVEGSWWRVLAVALATALAVGIPAFAIGLPFELGARAADSGAISLAGSIAVNTLAMPFAAIVTALLFFDLRRRRREWLAESGGASRV